MEEYDKTFEERVEEAKRSELLKYQIKEGKDRQ